MPRGIKKEKTLEGEIVELDRILLDSVKKNLSVARRLAAGSVDAAMKGKLEDFISHHVLTPKEDAPQEPAQAETLSEKDRRVYRVNKYLAGLTETDIQNVLELAKSMYRIRKGGNPSEPPSTEEIPEEDKKEKDDLA